MRRCGLIVVGLLLCLGLCGCGREPVREQGLIGYFNEKYDEDFGYVGSFAGSERRKVAEELLVTAERVPGLVSLVRLETEGGAVFYLDNYTHYRFEDAAREYLTGVMRKALGPDIEVWYSVPKEGTFNEFNASTSFAEFIHSAESGIVVNVVLPSRRLDRREAEGILRKVEGAVAEEGLNLTASVYIAPRSEAYLPYGEFVKWIYGNKVVPASIKFEMDAGGNFVKERIMLGQW